MVAKFEDQNHKLSVDVELTARVTGPAGRLDSAEATRIALYRVFGNVGEANDPIDDPTAGRLLQVSVGSDHVLGESETMCESTAPAKVSVLVLTEEGRTDQGGSHRRDRHLDFR